MTDQSGGVVPAATVTITNEATGVTHTGTTTSAGYYRFPALPGGVYTVKVSLQGFKNWTREHVRLESTQTRAVNVTLEVGSSGTEEVTVTATAPLVETSQGRVSGLIEEDQVKDLPLIGRNFFNLVVLTPGVTGRATGGGQSYAQANADIYSNEFGVNMNANGARTESNNFMVDSGTVSSSQRNGVVNINPNAESVEEVRVLVNNFSAEYGRNGSVLVNVITKSGANALHGSFGAYYTNESMQEENYFQKQLANFENPDFGRKEFSWGLGGPIRKDRTFFFVSGDVLRSTVAVGAPRTILTPQFIQFMQQARPNNISTRIARDFPASFTPDRNFRTAGQILGASCSGATPINSPIGAVPCNLPVTGEGTWNETSPRNGFQWTARVDHHFNQGKDRVFASFNRTTTDKVGFGTPEVYPAFTEASPTSSLQLNTNWTRIFSSNVVNELQFSWVRPYGELENTNADIPGITVSGLTQPIPGGLGPEHLRAEQLQLLGRGDLDARRAQHEVRPGLHHGARGQRLGARGDAPHVQLRQRVRLRQRPAELGGADRHRSAHRPGPRLDQAVPPHAVAGRLRPRRVEGPAQLHPQRGPALRDVHEHHGRLGRHRDQHRVHPGHGQPAERPRAPRTWWSGSTTSTAAPSDRSRRWPRA